MTDLPSHWLRTIEQHEWTLGNREAPMDAKQFRLGLEVIMREMEDETELTYDDAFMVRGQEDGTILFTIRHDLGSHGVDPKPMDAGRES